MIWAGNIMDINIIKNIIFNTGKFFIKYWHGLIVVLLSACFFIGTSSFNYLTQSYADSGNLKYDFVKWASPDETANYIFSKYFAEEGKLVFNEDYNLLTKDIIHPRSFRSDYGFIKPVSFLGVILIYGKIGSWLGYKVIPYLTPFFGAVGIFYFYLLIKKIFNKNNALISAFLLTVFPPYVYYSARSMFHNVLFTALLIIGLFYCVMMVEKKRNTKKKIIDGQVTANNESKVIAKLNWLGFGKTCWLNLLYAALAGLFIGLALTARASEALWLLPALVLLWIFNIKKIGLNKLLVFISFLFLSLLPMFYYNQVLYGSFYSGGYADMNSSIINIKDASINLVKSSIGNNVSLLADAYKKIRDNIFYFGFDFYQSGKMFYFYFIRMFYWLFIPAGIGFILFILRWWKIKYKHIVYFSLLLVSSAILIFYYGSWEFHDNPDKRSYTIGNSYTRYWLPVYLGVLPLVSFFILRLTKFLCYPVKWLKEEKKENKKFFILNLKPVYLKAYLRIIIIFFYIIVSVNFVLFGSEEGLFFLGLRQNASRQEWSRVLELTEENSVIITQYHDKLFFPQRKVIVGLFNDPNMNIEYANLAKLLPVYYYNFTFPEKDFNFLNRSRLADVGLSITIVKQITSDFTLYKLNSSK